MICLQFRGKKVHIRDIMLKNGKESTKVKSRDEQNLEYKCEIWRVVGFVYENSIV